MTHNLEQLSSYFQPQVESCAGGRVQGHFHGVLIDKTDIGGREVTEEFPFVSRVRTWRRHVELEHAASPVLALTLQHSSRVGVVVQQSPSVVGGFTGVLYQDSASHAFLNLTIIRGAGTVTGALTGAGGAIQALRLVLGPEVANSSHQVALTPGLVCRDSQVRVRHER